MCPVCHCQMYLMEAQQKSNCVLQEMILRQLSQYIKMFKKGNSLIPRVIKYMETNNQGWAELCMFVYKYIFLIDI